MTLKEKIKNCIFDSYDKIHFYVLIGENGVIIKNEFLEAVQENLSNIPIYTGFHRLKFYQIYDNDSYRVRDIIFNIILEAIKKLYVDFDPHGCPFIAGKSQMMDEIENFLNIYTLKTSYCYKKFSQIPYDKENKYFVLHNLN